MSQIGAAFPFLTAEDLQRLEGRFRQRRYAAGEPIVAEGDRRHALFILESGRARVERSHMGAIVPIAYMRPGEIFGEISFLDAEGASASVVADQDCQVATADRLDVDALLTADPVFASHFYRSLAVRLSERLRERTQHFFPPLTEG